MEVGERDSSDQLFREYEELVRPHVESFDYFLEEGLQRVIKNVKPIEMLDPHTGKSYHISLSNPAIGRPMHPLAKDGGLIYPRECREMKISYTAPLEMNVNINRIRVSARIAQVPIMVRSKLCNLRGMRKSELVRRGEEANDFGGYFVAGGLDKILRMLLTQKRDCILALERADFAKNGPQFSTKATVLRYVRDDEIGAIIRCHYLKNDTVVLGMNVGQYRCFFPIGVILRALHETSDRELFDLLTAACPVDAGTSHSIFVARLSEQCLAQLGKYGLRTRHEAVEFLGHCCRSHLRCPEHMSDFEAGMELLTERFLFHLKSHEAKFHLIINMVHKLYAFANSQCSADNPDSLATQEVMLPGFLFMKLMHDVFQQYLTVLSSIIDREWRKASAKADLEDYAFVSKIVSSRAAIDVGNKLLLMIKTGRFATYYSKDTGQDNGFTIVAERVNFLRYLSHFRAIHKGAEFTMMRTTQPRKLLPDSWGFLCPVHTPDGLPCGLLLHLTAGCKVTVRIPHDYDNLIATISKVLVKHGVVLLSSNLHSPPIASYLPVTLDGRVIGHIAASVAPKLVDRLRWVKVVNLARQRGEHLDISKKMELDSDEKKIPADMEVACVPYVEGEMYPGLFLSTLGGRFIREVNQSKSAATELIGSLEQQHLRIWCPDGSKKQLLKREAYTHEEIHTKNILSILAALTPFSEFNQSPRNMYQCQMAKQTMGTPCHDFQFRPDTKLYRLQTPQSPICRSQQYEKYHLDQYPAGTNAVVAVISFTGYDMEDAMILNKASVDRGFARGCIYKTQQHFLMEENPNQSKGFAVHASPVTAEKKSWLKRQGPAENQLPRNLTTAATSTAVESLGVAVTGDYEGADRIDLDGLPFPGAVIYPSQSYCSTVNYETEIYRPFRLKGGETAVVDQVTVIGNNKTVMSSANMRLRVDRTPVIGDKFASRAGQKGILSRMWTDIDFPFCANTGMRPDLIINPHAFPSRMTIGMLVESITSKAGALQGSFVDCSPFQSCDTPDSANKVELMGSYLEKAGFSRGGTETMICGMSGEEMECDIYVGLVYYQRLRHMVSDKYQCRATGPINAVTRQPVQGRKAGGGIRFGEMERDSVASHGAAYVLNDRLMKSSDFYVASICTRCESILTPQLMRPVLPESERRLLRNARRASSSAKGNVICYSCEGNSDAIERVAIPYVAGLLVAELAAVNISVKLKVTQS